MTEKLHIKNEMRCLDRKDRKFYDSLDDEEKKKFSPYLMIRWSSAVVGPTDLQEYYVQSCNHYVNRDFFTINKHPKLQWLLASAVSPGTGMHDHIWIKPKPKEKGSNDVKKLLMKLHPTKKLDEIELLSKLITKKEITEYLKAAGINE
jgi:hypothetical protein